MSVELIAIFFSAFATVGAAVAAVIGKRALDRVTAAKLEAETESVFIKNAENLVKLMEKRIADMQVELDTMKAALDKYQRDLLRAIEAEEQIKKELKLLRHRIDQLETFIREHGLVVPRE